MKRILEVSLLLVCLASASLAQTDSAKPTLRKGIHVQLPETQHATVLENADREDADIITLSRTGKLYDGLQPIGIDQVSAALRGISPVYVKVDERVPYVSVAKVLDELRAAGAQQVFFLTSQRNSVQRGAIVPPMGFDVLLKAASGVTVIDISDPDLKGKIRKSKLVELRAKDGSSFGRVVEAIDLVCGKGAQVALASLPK